MTDTNTGATHSFFDEFMDTRTPGALPSDFECYMLDAILAMQADAPANEQEDKPLEATPPPSSPLLQQPASALTYTAGLAADKMFPVPLLKCPLPAFVSFAQRYNLHPNLVVALRAARRRKTNRKSQRITRNRRASADKQQANLESDDEGDCNELDCGSVYAQLVAVSNAIMTSTE